MLLGPETARQVARALCLTALASTLAACGGARFSPITAAVPDEAPYALIHRPATGPEARAARRQGWRDSFVLRSLGGVLREISGADLLDPATLEQAGLAIDGELALFGLGLWPAVLIELRDPARFTRFVAAVAERLGPDAVSRAEVRGHAVETLRVGGARLSLTRVGDRVLIVYHRVPGALDALLAPALALDPARSLGRSRLLDDALDAVGDDHDELLIINTRRLDHLLLSRRDPLDAPVLDHLSPAGRERHIQAQRALEARCAAAGRRVTEHIPFVAFGSHRDGAARLDARLVVGLSAPLAADLTRVFPPLNGPLDALAAGAVVAFALRFDMAALVEVARGEPSTARCASLGALEGAAALLAHRLARTDALELFAGPIYGVLDDLDLRPAPFSKRAGALIFAAHDPARLIDGLAMYLRGLGFVLVEPSPPDAPLYNLGGFITASLAGVEGHAVLALGTLDRAALTARLTGPPTDGPDFARFSVDGARLLRILEVLVAQLSTVLAFDARAADSLLETFEGTVASRARAWIDGERVIIDFSADLDAPPP